MDIVFFTKAMLLAIAPFIIVIMAIVAAVTIVCKASAGQSRLKK